MKDLTPEHLRCAIAASCPAVYELEDGRLLIIGKRADESDLLQTPFVFDGEEEAIVIDRALLNVAMPKAERQIAAALRPFGLMLMVDPDGNYSVEEKIASDLSPAGTESE